MASFDKAETIIDLKGLYAQSELDRAAFNDELSGQVEDCYQRNHERLTQQFEESKKAQERADRAEA